MMYPFPSNSLSLVQLEVVLSDVTLNSNGNFPSVSIPGGFDHLIIELWGRTNYAATADDGRFWLNEDTTAANYRSNYTPFNNSSPAASAGVDYPMLRLFPAANSLAGEFGQCRLLIPFYAMPGKTRSMVGFGSTRRDATNNGLEFFAVNWESTAVIQSIRVTPGGGTGWAAGSRLQVLGVGNYPVSLTG
jgi:hypothetical protein